ncbi:hypothetical protein AMTR_s00068p00193050, partial [Amborella trichopoda]
SGIQLTTVVSISERLPCTGRSGQRVGRPRVRVSPEVLISLNCRKAYNSGLKVTKPSDTKAATGNKFCYKYERRSSPNIWSSSRLHFSAILSDSSPGYQQHNATIG